jgi:hypothetical protein
MAWASHCTARYSADSARTDLVRLTKSALHPLRHMGLYSTNLVLRPFVPKPARHGI